MFCIPKAALLHGKSIGFASQKSRFCSAKSKLPFFFRIIFTKKGKLLVVTSNKKRKSTPPRKETKKRRTLHRERLLYIIM
ncbi:hypothetical protein CBG55_00495 [Prevotella intermedia]|uniref:Uncharacterized protein n=1 Tax=Prevotella intermedia TaxID=28131 RepID=A0A2M8TL47_PREIN|nr:hypothetical protein CTM55_08490 [Prevotella intermedia]OWP32750.1 hypothetical protein CBG55_00495 [Prevotella intermedia]PJI24662.1 hypothetical protein CTM59_00515 [Prevotella intermedia]